MNKSKMFKIEIPDTYYQFGRLYHLLGIWSDADSLTWQERCRHLFYFFHFAGFMISLALGSFTTADKDESVFLAAVAIVCIVMVYRQRYILWQNRDILVSIEKIETSYTDDRNEFVEMSSTLNFFTKVVHGYLGSALSGTIPAVFLYPFFNEKRSLLFNIAFPLDRTKSEIGFWVAYLFVAGGVMWAVLCVLYTAKIWYIMVFFSVNYKTLGNQFKRLGMNRTDKPKKKVSIAEQHRHFQEDLKVAIQNYDRINSLLEVFGTDYSRLFFLQLLTGSISICGGIYGLAFSRHENMIMDGYNCAFLLYSVFDIFMIMYLGNEIKLASDQLSYCLFECNWMDQLTSGKKPIIILTERLKRSQELTVGKLYPLNLQTFTSVARAAYSMLNIVQNFRM
uniref:Odorant receptor n=1 Tax=Bradysia odoriphaga TaxID=1564500 RepID=A0A6B9C9F6_9DIPT|nr:odorant receptor 20 [Bradysia odoriphaga]